MQENQNENQESLEDVVNGMTEEQQEAFEEAIGGGIFTEDAEAIEGMRQAAEALGINPDLVAPTDDQVHYVAKKNCKHCYGRGAVPVVMSPQKEKTFSRNQALPGRITNRKRSSRGKPEFTKLKAVFPARRTRGPTEPRRKIVMGISPANENTNSQWDTRKPEPQDYKRLNATLAFCRCVKAISA